MDLVAEWGAIGVRRLHVLVVGLPLDAPLWREENAKRDQWTQTHELLAEILEDQDNWLYRIFSASGGKLRGPHKPLKFPRPGDKERNRVGLDDQKAIARFFALNR